MTNQNSAALDYQPDHNILSAAMAAMDRITSGRASLTPRRLREVEDSLEPDEPVFFDTETDGLYGYVTVAQFWQPSWKEPVLVEATYPPRFTSALAMMVESHANMRWVLHNAAYDLNTLSLHSDRPLHRVNIDDTMLLVRACTGFTAPDKLRWKFDSANLDTAFRRVYGFDPYARLNIDKKAMHRAKWRTGQIDDEQRVYALLDTVVTGALYAKLHGARGRMCYRVDIAATQALLRIKGLPVSVRRLEDERNKQEAVIESFDGILPPDLNVNSWQQVRAFLGTDQSDDLTLAYMANEGNKAAGAIREIRKARKLLSFIDKYMKLAPTVPGQFGVTTKSGRVACSHENLQQTPRALKRIWAPDEPGRVLMAADYSQLELRYVALVSKDRKMIRRFQTGEDLHQATAEDMGVPRQQAKSCNFNLTYLGSASMLRNILAKEGVSVSQRQAEQLRRAWLRAYPGIASWHEHVKRQHRFGYPARTNLGRVMFSERYTDAANLPIQGGAAEVAKIALVRLLRGLDENGHSNVKVVNFVHDSYVLEVDHDEEAWQSIAEILADAMQSAWRDILKTFPDDVPMPVDVAVGTDWKAADSGEGPGCLWQKTFDWPYPLETDK